jgi:hypothetical protein
MGSDAFIVAAIVVVLHDAVVLSGEEVRRQELSS